jgi:hypothetical protein
MSYTNGNLIGNRIIQRATMNPTGIYLNYFNRNNTIDTGLVANNEIILNATGANVGITATAARAKIVHNSIYILGTGAARGINLNNSTNNLIIVKNNNIVMQGNNAYPVYLNSLNNLNLYDIDYNNMYAPTYVGYAAGNKTTIAEWQQSILTDQHSVDSLPSFINASVNLELSDYTGLFCPSYPNVTKDINGNFRLNRTTMGAYTPVQSLDLAMLSVICKDTVISYPQTVPVKIVMENTGINAIDSVTLGWSINGEMQPLYMWIATNPLVAKEEIEIPVGAFQAGRATTSDIVVWVESVNGAKDAVVMNDTAKTLVKVLCTGDNLSIQSIEPLVAEGELCTNDEVSLKIKIENTGTLDYDFAVNPVTFSVRVTNPEPFSLDTVISTGEIKSGQHVTIELTDRFPLIVAGQYDIKVWMDSVSSIVYDDTLSLDFVSGKFGLPIDEEFSSDIPLVFVSNGINTYKWEVIPQGVGTDTVVKPQFGTGMLSFKGSPGSMTTLSTRQLDLSRTVQPSLSFWYFHDTIPSEDYTDVRITIDGGVTYNTLYSLTKYDAVYGWKQYSADLPAYAVNQCVILLFEAMEKSRSGDVTQYIDRILITARQDIAIAEIFTSPLSVCDLENKDLKVVMQNLSNPVLNYVTNPTTLTLEIKETGQSYDTLLSSGSLAGFASDTITLATGINFAVGTYTLKAYFSSVLDVDRNNDTFVVPVVINPALSVQVQSESMSNCIAGEIIVYPTITINNTGNMDLSNIDLIIQIDTGDNNPAVYALFREIYTDTILAGNSAIYIFTNAYSVPWNARYDVRVNASLNCDSALAHNTNMIQECVDVKDLRIVSIDNPTTGTIDNIGSSIQVMATFNNRSDGDIFNNISVTYSVRNSQGIQTETSTENITIGLSETVSHIFNVAYAVPNDTVYYLAVYVESRDNYRNNDTMTIKRETNNVGVETLGNNIFTLGQNIPNPAKNTTRIDYSIPETGEVIFHIHSISGQLLYSKTIEATSGKQSLELNTNTLTAGIYIYSIEYKGQRLIKRMSVQK